MRNLKIIFTVIFLLWLFFTIFIEIAKTNPSGGYVSTTYAETPVLRDLSANIGGLWDSLLTNDYSVDQDPDIPGLIVSRAMEWGLDPEIMLRIVACESGFKQEVRSPTNDYGVMQIHLPTWLKLSKQMGLNIYELEDNVEMGMWIAVHYGYDEWVCFDK